MRLHKAEGGRQNMQSCTPKALTTRAGHSWVIFWVPGHAAQIQGGMDSPVSMKSLASGRRT